MKFEIKVITEEEIEREEKSNKHGTKYFGITSLRGEDEHMYRILGKMDYKEEIVAMLMPHDTRKRSRH